MSQNLVVNGVTYPFPDVSDQNWGQDVTDWANAVTGGMLQKSGGSFTLTAEVDFGASYGVKSLYVKSRGANPSTTGIVRLANTEAVSWRDAANAADLALSVNASDVLTFAGNPIVSKTALAASRALVSDAGGIITASVVTSAELGYLSGVTSAIQTQFNAKAPTASPTFSGTITTPLTASRALVTGASSELAASAVTATELGYVSGVTSAIQTQINAKAPSASPTFSGTVTTPLTASRAVVTGASNELAASTVTSTELGYLSGVTSAVQTQLNAKAALNAAAATGAWTFDTSTIVVDSANHRVGLGEASPAAILHTKAATNTGIFESTGDYSQIKIKDSTKSCYIGTYHGDFRVGVNDGGIASQVFTITTAGYLDVPGVYSETTASAANVFVASDGSIQRSTSSAKYKRDVRDLSDDEIEKILSLRPVAYKSRQKMDGDRDFIGIIAEEAEAAGLGILVSYGSDGKPDGFMYERVVAPLIGLIKNLHHKVSALEKDKRP